MIHHSKAGEYIWDEDQGLVTVRVIPGLQFLKCFFLQKTAVKKIIIHPNYESTSDESFGDIALLELATDVSKKHCQRHYGPRR